MNKTAARRASLPYFLAHCAVEIACFYFMFSRFGGSPLWWSMTLLYDALAFLPQGLLGEIMDKHPELAFGPLGLGMILLALFIPSNIIAISILTIGNCLVHVAGAQATLRDARGEMGPSGIFVGGGSFGVVTGQLLGIAKVSVWIPASCVAVALLILCALYRRQRLEGSMRAEVTFDCAASLPYAWIVFLIFLTVAARSYVGYAIPTAWKKTAFQSILLFCSMGVGKCAGGILADRIGARKAAVGSLVLSIPLLILGDQHMTISLLGVAFFSMTMPISLGVLASVLPEEPGAAFGVTTTALFAGTLPIFFVVPVSYLSHVILVILLTGIAAACFLLASTDANVIMNLNSKEE